MLMIIIKLTNVHYLSTAMAIIKKIKKITIIPTLKIKIKNKTLPSKIWYKSTHLLYKNHEFRIRPFP